MYLNEEWLINEIPERKILLHIYHVLCLKTTYNGLTLFSIKGYYECTSCRKKIPDDILKKAEAFKKILKLSKLNIQI
jgi:hypothetical protein